jgi:hypothetical protein
VVFINFIKKFFYNFVMVKVDEAFEVRYKKGGEQFEVLVDFDKLKEFEKSPDTVSVYDVLADVKIFRDQKKGRLHQIICCIRFFLRRARRRLSRRFCLRGRRRFLLLI